MSLSMEPSHKVFEEEHDLFDSEGNVIPPLPPPHSIVLEDDEDGAGFPPESSTLSVGNRSLSPSRHRVHHKYPATSHLSASGSLPHHRYYSDVLRDVDRHASNHSVYTLHSVLMADGVVNQLDEDAPPSDLPARYKEGSVKAKITWFGAICVAGLGMYVEAFVIITTGQIKTIWHGEYPECWEPDAPQSCPDLIQCCDLFPNTPFDNNDGSCAASFLPADFCDVNDAYPGRVLCREVVTMGVSYSEFAGIMAGMVTFGAICDLIGRKNAGTLTSLLMIVGMAGMTFFDSSNSSTLFISFSVFFAVFGLGVGGEYPLTASGAAEHHAANADDSLEDDEERHRRRLLFEAATTVRRGETISLIFAMQGIGAVVGSVVLLCFIYFSNQSRINCDKGSSNSTGNNPDALSGIWRSFYFIGLEFVIMLLLYRSLILKKDAGHSQVKVRQRRREAMLGKEANSKWKILKFYAPRLIGTGGNWFVWDITFYGLKLYSGPIFASLNPQGTR